MFSALSREDQKYLVMNIFPRLLDLSDIYPIGIQLSGFTLEKISDTNYKLIERLIDQIENDKCEIIANGYSQMITPLAPFKVNQKNQEIGFDIYEKILKCRPKIFTINEMAISSSCVDLAVDSNYKAMLTEWNNPRLAHPEWEDEWRYQPQYALSQNNQKISLIWTDSIVFQQFQRFIHGQIGENEYHNFIEKIVIKQ